MPMTSHVRDQVHSLDLLDEFVFGKGKVGFVVVIVLFRICCLVARPGFGPRLCHRVDVSTASCRVLAGYGLDIHLHALIW